MSTGEVACFGVDRFDAYLKALISTGYRLPKKNILVSIGSYKAKQELLTAIRTLKELGYELYASIGTADYFEANNISINPIDWKYEQTEANYIGLENGNGDSPSIESNPQTTIADYLANGSFDLVSCFRSLFELLFIGCRLLIFQCVRHYFVHLHLLLKDIAVVV